MKFEVADLYRLALPMVAPFRTSTGTQRHRHALLVRVEGPEGEGWGECAALDEPTYTSEYADGAHAVIRDHLLPRLAVAGDVTAAGVGPALAGVKGHPMAKSALEMAVLDAELRAAGRSLAQHLGGVRDRVASGVSVGIAAGIDELVAEVGDYLEQGYVRVKLKIEPGWDVTPVAAVRAAFGAGVPLQVDANGSYGRDDIPHLSRLDAFGLLLVEQPFAEDDLTGHAELARALSTPVCLDETITSTASALTAVERGACSVINVKPGRVGGYLEARRLHDACRDRGVGLWCGGMFETGLGRAANLALASLPGFTIPGDISASDRYWRRDVTEPWVLDGGHLAVPRGPGIGARPDPDALRDLTRSVERVALAAA